MGTLNCSSCNGRVFICTMFVQSSDFKELMEQLLRVVLSKPSPVTAVNDLKEAFTSADAYVRALFLFVCLFVVVTLSSLLLLLFSLLLLLFVVIVLGW